MRANNLREAFLNFFVAKGHEIIPSASLIPPTEVELAGTQKVLFTTAGMHPLIPYLVGKPHPQGTKLVNVQKCLRTDDIEDVGDSWHNTFFEMLGNWSLGDYGKVEAIHWSFEFLVKELKLNPARIFVTIFGGDVQIPGVLEDSESVAVWKSLGISEDRILRLGKKDNWWGPVGEVGPCGPDTEIFYDAGIPAHGTSCHPGDDCGKFAEIWNDVFMEFNKTAEGKFEPLKQKNVDTGMGVERTVAILQGKNNVYDTELFQDAMQRIKIKATNFELRKARIIADHLRAAAFLIADGVVPISADDRGSVLVRLITNAMSKGREIGIDGSFASWVTDAFIDVYRLQYPELENIRSTINNIISQEEERYQFKALSERALKLEERKFRTAVKQPEATFVSNASNAHGANLTFEELRKRFRITMSAPTVSAAIGTVSGDLKTTYGIPPEESLKAAERFLKNLGQSFNREEAINGLNVILELHKEVSKQKGAKRFAGGLADHSKAAIAGHTATHLLHQALRDVLGTHVKQTGSHITSERLRFDFTHDERLNPAQLKKVEEVVNKQIERALEVRSEVMALKKAQQIGAIGLFGEKYGEKVSVYFIGDYSARNKTKDWTYSVRNKTKDWAYSKEFCGGPHAKNTAELGRFKIIKEESAGAGIRRIYAKLESLN